MGVAVHVPCRNRATTAKKCTKQRVKLFFLPFSLPSPSLLLKLPMEILETQNCLPRGLSLIV